MADLVSKAEAFARVAHGSIDQRRKYSNDPYIVHPEAVAGTVASVTEDRSMIAAAWLHDVVEDTPVTIHQIEKDFGQDIAGVVAALTKASTKSDGSRQQRKDIDRRHIAKADPRAKTIKLADLIDNLSGIVNEDREFARTYVREKELQLEVLVDGDPSLFKRVQKIIQRSKSMLTDGAT